MEAHLQHGRTIHTTAGQCRCFISVVPSSSKHERKNSLTLFALDQVARLTIRQMEVYLNLDFYCARPKINLQLLYVMTTVFFLQSGRVILEHTMHKAEGLSDPTSRFFVIRSEVFYDAHQISCT